VLTKGQEREAKGHDGCNRAGKEVERRYCDEGLHTLILDLANKDDAMRRVIHFFTRRLKACPSNQNRPSCVR
jgi:hypothetical protein